MMSGNHFCFISKSVINISVFSTTLQIATQNYNFCVRFVEL